MMTPISSMQNVLAASYLQQSGFDVSFGRWICVSLPFGVTCTLIAWVYLIVVMKPDDISEIPVIVYERENKVLSKRNILVVLMSLFTILLFANFPYVEFIFGEIGIVAAAFVGLMFGSGILSEVYHQKAYIKSFVIFKCWQLRDVCSLITFL
jgi:di/tricarboxylate transporter